MTRSLRLGLVLVLLLTTFTVASADYTGPYYDTWLTDNASTPDNNPTAGQLKVADSKGACTDTELTYFQFDVDVFGTVDTASLVLTHGATLIGIETSPILTLYGVADFDPATLNSSNNPPTAGAYVIQSVTIPSTTKQYDKVTFGNADQGLRNYIQSEQIAKGDTTISLALSFSANCNSANSTINLYSQEATTAGYRPAWSITGTKPTAVTMTKTSAQQTNTLPLYAGLGGLALIAVVGVAISRRRTSTR